MILLLCLAATLFMTGVIWIVQIVHYALFDGVGADGWSAYHRAHSRRITFVVLLPMVVELGTAGLMAFSPLFGIPHPVLWLGLLLAASTWAVTFFVSVPLHGRLARDFDADTWQALVRTNWARTLLWTAHAVVLLAALEEVLERGRAA
jgi:hypothetical protein